MKLLKLFKYYLGFKSIVKIGGKFYIVKGLGLKAAMDRNSNYWWVSREYWGIYCSFNSYEEAQQAVNLYNVEVL